MPRIRVGVQLHPQHTTFDDFADAVCAAEEAGADTLWTWDHFFPLRGAGNHFECWTLLSSMAMLTSQAEIGSLVTCNNYRNPHLLADMARTVDHISGGRLILGIGAGWFERDYQEYGYEFGTVSSRLKELKNNLPVIKERMDQLVPPPVRNPIPLLIGGGGEKVTLRLAAQYAQMWNDFGTPESYKHKNQVLDNWCRKIGRDPAEVERSITISILDLHNLDAYVAAGATHIILGWAAPWDVGLVEQLIMWRDNQA